MEDRMPLSSIGVPGDNDLGGIVFELANGDRRQICVVTPGALADLASANMSLSPGDEFRVFYSHRDTIERTASAKFDAGIFDPNGRIKVDALDLLHAPPTASSAPGL
jgi:hypothetical protein